MNKNNYFNFLIYILKYKTYKVLRPLKEFDSGYYQRLFRLLYAYEKLAEGRK